MQGEVGHPVVGNDGAEARGDVEPLDDAAELNDARSLAPDPATGAALNPQTAARPLRSNSIRRHDAPTPPLMSGAPKVRAPNLCRQRRYHRTAYGKGQNALECRKRWMPVYILPLPNQCTMNGDS